MTPRPRKPTDKIRAVVYVRVSTDSQAESGLSLEHQREKCRALATLNEAVLIAKLDRLTRSVRDLADLLDMFARHRVALVSASESLNTETAAGRMVVRLLAVVSEWEREAIGERTRDALTAKRRRGERTSRHTPLGFQLTPDGRLEPNDSERQQLAVMAECRAAGYSWHGIAAEMNRLGHTNRAGRPWKWQNVRRVYTTATKHGNIVGAAV